MSFYVRPACAWTGRGVRFHDSHGVAAYLGLVPGEDTTGGPSKRRLGGITKQGNTHARTMLIQAAWTILRLRSSNDPMKRWAEHIAQTRGKKIAAVALARKLAGVLWAMLRDGTAYDNVHESQQTARGVKEQATRALKRAQSLEMAAKKLRRSRSAEPDAKAARPPAKVGRTERRKKTA